MNDHAARWGLDDFGDLYWYSRVLSPPPLLNPHGCALTAWVWAADRHRRQEIAAGSGAADWVLAIEAAEVRFYPSRAHTDWISLPLAGADWQQIALAFDRRLGRVDLVSGGGHAAYTPPSPLFSTLAMQQFMVGGRTDPAGGHFDHTFGRGGSGLLDDLRVFDRPLTAAELAAIGHDARLAGEPPRVTVSLSPAAGDAPLEVRAAAAVTSAAPIAAYLWDFGDGERAAGAAVTHRYAYAGDYVLHLRVIDADHRQTVITPVLSLGGQPNPLRFVPVFVNGTEGYACYRIPSIVRAATGDLLAFAEARLESCSDSTKTIHIVSKRSADGGATWSPLTVVAAVPGYVAMNAAPVVDVVHGTGRVVVVLRAADQSEWHIARGVGLSRALVVTSDDHGVTWTAPRDITADVHHPYQPAYADVCPAAALPENAAHDWRIQIPSQGHAIQLTRLPHIRGRLLFAGSFTRGDHSIFDSENYVFWSDDLGATWQIGGIIPRLGLNEAIAAELADGGVIINTRAYTDGQPDGRRAVTRAHFDAAGGIQFAPTHHDEALIDPAVQATLLRASWPDDPGLGNRSRLIFANPAHPLARVNLTVRVSYDEGETWPCSTVIDSGPAAYSDLVSTADGEIGLLFERGNTGGIVFVRFSLAWLEGEGKSG